MQAIGMSPASRGSTTSTADRVEWRNRQGIEYYLIGEQVYLRRQTVLPGNMLNVSIPIELSMKDSRRK